MAEVTDEEMVKRIQSSAYDLFDLLIDRYETKLVRYAWRFLKTTDNIQDKIQNICSVTALDPLTRLADRAHH